MAREVGGRHGKTVLLDKMKLGGLSGIDNGYYGNCRNLSNLSSLYLNSVNKTKLVENYPYRLKLFKKQKQKTPIQFRINTSLYAINLVFMYY